MALPQDELLDPAFLARLERLELSVRKLLAGERRGEVSTRRRGTGTLFREHRGYVPGDDPRFLDWNAYLRLGDLLIKEFESEETPRLLLLVDRSASMGVFEGGKLQAALRIAAALGAVGLSRHTGVACLAFPGGAPAVYRGRASLRRLLGDLAALDAGGEARFLPSFQAACPPGRPAGIAVVLSDFYAGGEYATALRFLRHRGFLTHAVHVVDPRERTAEAGDALELRDVETGRIRRERIDADMARAYVEVVERHLRTVEETCRGLQVLHARVEVGEPVERTVMDLLRRGALAR
jgi:uncharacterized protein (DUF58 family)